MRSPLPPIPRVLRMGAWKIDVVTVPKSEFAVAAAEPIDSLVSGGLWLADHMKIYLRKDLPLAERWRLYAEEVAHVCVDYLGRVR